MSRTSAMEGMGGPINMSSGSTCNPPSVDPTLDSCCQRELLANRKRNALEDTLRRHDRVASAELSRRNVISVNFVGAGGGSFNEGCRCCYDPKVDGGEYSMLREERAKLDLDPQDLHHEEKVQDAEDSDEASAASKSSEDSSDSEFDYLLEEEHLPSHVASHLEERRREELQRVAERNAAILHHGYGVHRQHGPLRVFVSVGLLPPTTNNNTRHGMQEEDMAVVLHLYDPESVASARLDLLLEQEAPNYKGTKFIRSQGRAALTMTDPSILKRHLPSLKPTTDLPALVAIRNGVVIAHCPKLQGLISEDMHVDTLALRQWMDRAGVLLRDPPMTERLCRIRPEEDALVASMMALRGPSSVKETSEEAEVYACGVAGCEKTFRHEHVGVQNEEQNGLVVKEEVVVGEE